MKFEKKQQQIITYISTCIRKFSKFFSHLHTCTKELCVLQPLNQQKFIEFKVYSLILCL